MWKAWQAAPLLPAFACALAVAHALLVPLELSTAPAVALPGWLASLALGVFWIGWLGAQRVWYLRAFRSAPFGPRLLWLLSWRFLGRFLRLGLLLAWRFILLWVLLLALFVLARRAGGYGLPAWYGLAAFACGIPMSAVLTFGAPALCYTTRSPAEALRIGFAMTRTFWPDVALYVLLPPAAILVMARISAQQLGGGLLLAGAMSALMNVLLTGAAASFFLRHNEVVPEALPPEARLREPEQSEEGG
ncbi:MAG TPA: hypothetical protein VK009_28490 [Chloroflexota bacterium]|nr:hypothetical protein [Chloroflexota bacterium]